MNDKVNWLSVISHVFYCSFMIVVLLGYFPKFFEVLICFISVWSSITGLICTLVLGAASILLSIGGKDIFAKIYRFMIRPFKYEGWHHNFDWSFRMICDLSEEELLLLSWMISGGKYDGTSFHDMPNHIFMPYIAVSDTYYQYPLVMDLNTKGYLSSVDCDSNRILPILKREGMTGNIKLFRLSLIGMTNEPLAKMLNPNDKTMHMMQINPDRIDWALTMPMLPMKISVHLMS